MNKQHQEILNEIQKKSGKKSKYFDDLKYHGTTRLIYPITTPESRLIAKEWAKKNKEIDLSDFLLLLDSLFAGESHTERTFGGKLLEYLPSLRKQIKPEKLNDWLDNLQGWSEVDCLCQSTFTSKELLTDWVNWEKLLKKFSQDKNISKRRASLVLLTGPVTTSDDERLVNTAFFIIDRLKSEKDILITKAISWLLRSMIKNFRLQVEEYLKQNINSLPKIALRETRNKLLKGKK